MCYIVNILHVYIAVHYFNYINCYVSTRLSGAHVSIIAGTTIGTGRLYEIVLTLTTTRPDTTTVFQRFSRENERGTCPAVDNTARPKPGNAIVYRPKTEQSFIFCVL